MYASNDEFQDAAAVPDEKTSVRDWLNLPPASHPLSLWDCLHDAEVVSIRSSLLQRMMELVLEIGHLSEFHHLGEGFQFQFHLEGVQSARVLHSAIWSGGCSIPTEISREEESKLIREYQDKWRQESASWNGFETSVTGKDDQVFIISDAAILAAQDGAVALKLCGQLNQRHKPWPEKASDVATYHEVFLRAERLRISGSDVEQFALEDFRKLGETYWEAFSRRKESRSKELHESSQ